MDLDIEGDHLIPVIWNRRLYLFWPIFRENSTVVASGVQKSLQLQLAWSEYRNSAWTKKQVTVNSLTPSPVNGYSVDDALLLSFRALPEEAGLTVTVYQYVLPPLVGPATGTYGEVNVGWFSFTGCSTTPDILFNENVVSEDWNMRGVPIPINTFPEYMDLVAIDVPLTLTFLVNSGTERVGSLLVPLYTPGPFPVLLSSPKRAFPYTLCYPQQFLWNLDINARPPFFYADGSRTYLATPIASQFVTILSDPSNAIVPYSSAQLNPPLASLRPISQLPIFETQVVAGGTKGLAPTQATFTSGTSSLANINDGNRVATGQFSEWDNSVLQPQTPILTFSSHYHPHVCDFLKALNWQGVPGLLTLANQQLDPKDIGTASKFYTTYSPANSVTLPYPSEEIDFSPDGAYSLYNWEIFFHIPFLIATQLSQNQQFDDAEKWFRYIFNPSNNSTAIRLPSVIWNVLPFYQETEADAIGSLLAALDYTGSDPALLAEKASFGRQVAAWQESPFDPDRHRANAHRGLQKGRGDEIYRSPAFLGRFPIPPIHHASL